MMTLAEANRTLLDPDKTFQQSAEASRVVGDHYRAMQLWQINYERRLRGLAAILPRAA